MRKTTMPERRSAGFSLVEIMVAVAIGMLAIIVMLQMFALSEARKRTTTNGADAQSNGVITFYQLQRDIEQAGYGISAMDLFNCKAKWKVAGTDIATSITLAPVVINPSTSIVPAGDPNTDTLLVVFGNTSGEPQGNAITYQASTTQYKVATPSLFSKGDWVIAAPSSCASDLIAAQVSDVLAPTVTTTDGASGATLYDLGPSPTIVAYRVRKGNLTACDYLAHDCGKDADKDNDSIWTPIANNVVSLRAQYARDTTAPMDGVPDTYDQASITSACGWARVPALRLAIVARSAQYEKEAVTTAAPTWAGSAGAPVDLTRNYDGTANANWTHYRYKLFEGIVSMRNVVWMKVTGC